nr:glycosyltransferase [Antrihabitans stalactiti]
MNSKQRNSPNGLQEDRLVNSSPPQLVSVIIPAYNAKTTIDVQLSGLAEQDYAGIFEVIVSDNGSTDGLATHIEQHPLRTKLNLRCIDSCAVRGAPFARNAGAAAARGEFLAFCDADDRVHTQWLNALVSAGNIYDSVSGPVEVTTLNSPKVATWRKVGPRDKQEETGFLPFGLSGNFGIWRKAFDKVGGFDETLKAGEDVDFSWRLQLAGLTLGHAPDALIAIRLRDSYSGTWQQAFAYGEAGPRLYRDYRVYGLRRTKPLLLAVFFIALIVRNPLIPTFITRMSTGQWVYYAAFAAGRIKGSIRHRIYFL